MIKPEEIKGGNVYSSATGERRLVTTVQGQFGPRPVVMWRTVETELQPTQKAHGSCTLASFQKWADSYAQATKADWEAFDEAMRRRNRTNAYNRGRAAFRKRANTA